MIEENSLLDMTDCQLCPRNCRVNRKERTGFCGEKDGIRCARAALHYWRSHVSAAPEEAELYSFPAAL